MTGEYLVITPAKDEERYIANTLQSVTDQTLLPRRWIVVDDGSCDATSEIVDHFTRRYSWITLVTADTGSVDRAGGAKVVSAFYRGYDMVCDREYEFIVKLDADLTLPEDYFEKVTECFRSNPRIGLCGGYCVVEKNGIMVKERSAGYHLRGALKAYRKECFDDIGGLMPICGWDGIDEMTAMSKGWEVKILPIAVHHHRATGTSYSRLKHRFRTGVETYRIGNDLALGVIRAIVRLGRRPYVIGSVMFILGYLYAVARRLPKHVDEDLQRFIRRFHYNRILKAIRIKL